MSVSIDRAIILHVRDPERLLVIIGVELKAVVWQRTTALVLHAERDAVNPPTLKVVALTLFTAKML